VDRVPASGNINPVLVIADQDSRWLSREKTHGHQLLPRNPQPRQVVLKTRIAAPHPSGPSAAVSHHAARLAARLRRKPGKTQGSHCSRNGRTVDFPHVDQSSSGPRRDHSHGLRQVRAAALRSLAKWLKVPSGRNPHGYVRSLQHPQPQHSRCHPAARGDGSCRIPSWINCLAKSSGACFRVSCPWSSTSRTFRRGTVRAAPRRRFHRGRIWHSGMTPHLAQSEPFLPRKRARADGRSVSIAVRATARARRPATALRGEHIAEGSGRPDRDG